MFVKNNIICPKCSKGVLIPLSLPHQPFAKWKCSESKCKYTVTIDTSIIPSNRKDFPCASKPI